MRVEQGPRTADGVHAAPHSLTAAVRHLRALSPDVTCLCARLRQARTNAWRRMSEAARSQFAWPVPGIPRLEGDAAFDVADKSTIADDVRARGAQPCEQR